MQGCQSGVLKILRQLEPLPWRPTDGRLPRRVVRVTPSDRKRSRADRCYIFNIFCGRRRDGRRCDEQTGGGGGGLVARSTASCVAPRWGRERGRRSGVRVAMARRSAADAPPERARVARTAPAEPRSRGWLRTRCMCVVCTAFVCNSCGCARLWPVAVGRIDVLRRPHDHRASCLHSAAVCVLVCIKPVARAADSHSNVILNTRRLLYCAYSPTCQYTYDMHALPVCSDM